MLSSAPPFEPEHAAAHGMPPGVATLTPVRPALSSASMLPAALTPLIGREREMQELSALLQDDDIRLLVLTGPGGVGKTRIAISVAHQLQTAFRNGAVLVNLAPVTQANLVMPAIAEALGIREEGIGSLEDAITAALADRQVLMLLDNFEHLLDAAEPVARLLTANPGLTMLVTSRSVLDVYGEHTYPVAPLSTIQTASPGEDEKQETLLENAPTAVQFFVNRARAVRPHFQLTPENFESVQLICSHLDGLPLAIELAAAQMRVLTPAALAGRLSRRLNLLGEGPRNVPSRLRTMRSAIAWSYDLLSPDEQRLFRQLAIFAGEWSFADAEPIVFGSGETDTSGDMLHVVSSLMAKSLIFQTERTTEAPHFGMLQVLREFGLEKLDVMGERETIAARHATAMLEVARQAEPELTGPNQLVWLDRLTHLHADLRAAFTWFLKAGADHDGATKALELATSLWRFGYVRGHVRESRWQLSQALAHVPDRTALRATALNGAGLLANIDGDAAQMRASHTEALEIGQELDDARAIGIAQFGLGDAAMADGDATVAEQHYRSAEAVFERDGSQRGVAAAKTNLGNMFWDLSRLDEALQTHAEAKRLFEQVGDQRGVSWAVTNIGRLAAEQDEHATALANLNEALTHYDALGDPSGIAESIEAIALVAHNTQQHEIAVTLLGAASQLRVAVSRPVPARDRPRQQRLRQQLTDRLGAAFAPNWERGQQLPTADMLRLARELTIPNAAVSPAEVRKSTTEDGSNPDATLKLTPREMQILNCLAQGMSDRETGLELFISPRTVQTHIANLFTKLNVKSRTGAVSAFHKLPHTAE